MASQLLPLLREAARLEQHGDLPRAAALYQQALLQDARLPDAWYNLGLLQRRLGQFDAALASYAQALAHGVRHPEEVHLNRGVIFADCLRQDEAAERELRTALSLNPTYLPALQNLANLKEDLGDREQARALYARILELQPRSFEALARYAQLTEPAGPDDPMITRLRAALVDPAASAHERAALGFVLVRLLDAVGQYPAAFAAAEAANRASRESAGGLRYDRGAQERLVDELIRTFPVPAGGTAAPARPTVSPTTTGAPNPIFICGMFRSGSTLAERLLAGHPQVAAGGELDILPRLVQQHLTPFPASLARSAQSTRALMARQYLEQLVRLFPNASHVTDKRLDNFLYIGLIKLLFPTARIVHTTRDALDTCLSVFFLHLDQRMTYALDLLDIGHYFRQYRRLMAHWRSLYAQDMLDFNYDELVRDPRGSAGRLLRFCGLEWDEACLAFAHRPASVRTASVWQVREPLYQRSSGRARYYQRELAPLAASLAEP